MIFQDPMTSLNPVLTIGRQITESLRLHLGMNSAQANNRAVELLDMVGIPDPRRRLKSYPHQFSGGQRQRIMIAMALACNPQLLIADEPTTALDVTIQAEILDLVRQLSRELGMAMIWITHDLGVVAGLADTIQVMYGGRIMERGPIDVVFKDPRSAYTLGLLHSIPRLDRSGERLKPIEGSPPDMRFLPAGDAFAPRNPYATERCWNEVPPLAPAPDSHPEHLVAAWYDLRQALKTDHQAQAVAVS
jgi:peptide/nickel transport system ATP-binding protein/oligopeptide transport system ATP-binding protein